MKNVLVIHRSTPQAKSFERVAGDYTVANNIPINWIYCSSGEIDTISKENVLAVALISPEMILVEKQIKEKLDSLNIPNLSMKPVDFGLKRMEKVIPLIETYL